MAAIIREVGDSKEIKLEGARFTVRALDYKTYNRLLSKLVLAKTAINPGNKDLSAEDIKKLQNEDFEKYVQANDAISAAYEGFVKAGVVGHSDLVKKSKDGGRTEIPFKAAVDGGPCEEILELYRSQKWVATLANEVIGFNCTTEQEEKN